MTMTFSEQASYMHSEYKPLGTDQTQPPMSGHDGICVHTMVGYLSSTFNYFATGNGQGYKGTESHFGVGGKWGPDLAAKLDGDVWQFQDLKFTADAQYEGNPRMISIETADNAPQYAKDIEPWTTMQLETLIKLIARLCDPATHKAMGCPSAWSCTKVGIPPVLMANTKPTTRGIGYHSMGNPGTVVPGGEIWSPDSHDCPGPVRIKQLTDTVIPAVAKLVNGSVTPPPAPQQPAPTSAQLQTLGESGMVILIQPGTGFWYHLVGNKLVGLTSGAKVTGASATLVQCTDTEWTRYLAAGLTVVL